MPATTSGSLPPPADLANEQLRGTACVWCAEPIVATTAVGYGVWPDLRYPGVSWYPRACPACAEARS